MVSYFKFNDIERPCLTVVFVKSVLSGHENKECFFFVILQVRLLQIYPHPVVTALEAERKLEGEG